LDASKHAESRPLARGELHCIGATTLDEYRKHIEKGRRTGSAFFQPVFIDEPSVEDTISILRGIKEKYELHHGVRITDGAIVAAATLSNRYITDRFSTGQGDRSDGRGRLAVCAWRSIRSPKAIDELDRRIVQLKIEREALKKESDPASRDRLEKLVKELEEARAALGRADRTVAGREGQARRRAEAQGAARPGPRRA